MDRKSVSEVYSRSRVGVSLIYVDRSRGCVVPVAVVSYNFPISFCNQAHCRNISECRGMEWRKERETVGLGWVMIGLG